MLQISHLSADYGGKPALADINLTLDSGELLVVLGPSGCGKTTLLNLIAGFVPYQHGSITLEGQRVEGPGADRGVVFQHEGLLPWRNVQDNVALGLQLAGVDKTQRRATAARMLKKVGLEGAEKRFIWQLSGGQRQRVLIAMALTRDPKLIIADEPTTALDVTVQKQVIDLLNELREKLGFAMIFVSHDLALVAEVAHNITVMYAGQVIEQAPTQELLTHPTHEYTRGLLGAVLSIESGSGRLHQVPGTVPSPRDFPIGDRFAPRSSHPDYGLDIRPVLTEVGPEHVYAALPPREEVLVSSETIVIEEGQEEN